MELEWDGDKAALNLQKHGVSFEDAALVFYDHGRSGQNDAFYVSDGHLVHVFYGTHQPIRVTRIPNARQQLGQIRGVWLIRRVVNDQQHGSVTYIVYIYVCILLT
jgi:hypothetical protein